MNHTILIVEDEEKLAQLIKDYLASPGYESHIFATGAGVVEWVKEHKPSVILLDLMLPEKDGISICKDIRQFSPVPIIMVTAKVEEIDRLLGLELGADDYVCKPFSPRELVARVKAQIRRTEMNSPKDSSPNDNNFNIDPEQLKVHALGKTVDLTTIEMEILAALYARINCVFSREKLIDQIYNDHRVVSDRTIDSHIKKLRKKLQSLNEEHTYIQSVYGAGYRFILP